MSSHDENRAPATDWNSVNWRKTETDVRRLRQRIFRAERLGNARKVRSLQRLMLRSYANRLVAVRRVTQINQGKFTPGVDKLTIKTPAARGVLVDSLNVSSRKPLPARRVYIPKSDGSKRPLGIPVIYDRALQAVVKNALEPQWEARFEECSYGFRPGRRAHDAVELLFTRFAAHKSHHPWVIDADIRKAFDRISHEFILGKLDRFPAKELIERWLKAGVVEDGGFFESSEEGTPQGGVISPLLANIALDGMEDVIPRKRLVRYADDFVILCKSRSEAETILAMTKRWLAKRGLEISEQKTRIVHITEGFDFLGFNVRQYATPWNRKMNKNPLFVNPREGNTILVKPSKNARKRYRKKLKDAVLRLRGAPPETIVRTLNPIIRGWTNYYASQVSSRVFSSMDYYLWILLWKWARRRHGNKGRTWIANRYWGRHAPWRRDRWVFGGKANDGPVTYYLLKHAWTPIRRHTLLRGAASPDNPEQERYWRQRRRKDTERKPLGIHRTLGLLQKSLCPHCGQELDNGEKLNVHHKVPKHSGGTDHILNLQSVHLYCHQQIHSKRS